jgi:hypothetical protein
MSFLCVLRDSSPVSHDCEGKAVVQLCVFWSHGVWWAMFGTAKRCESYWASCQPKKSWTKHTPSQVKKTHVHLPCTSQFTQWIQHELSVPGNPKIILYTSSTISLTSDSSWPASFHFAGEGEACKAAKRTASPTGWRQQQKQTENSVAQPQRRQQQKALDHAATQTATACYPCAMVLQIDLSNKGSRLTLPDISNII